MTNVSLPIVESPAEAGRRPDERIGSTRRAIQEASQQLHASTRIWAKRSAKMGTLAEDFIRPIIPSILQAAVGCSEEQIEMTAAYMYCRHPVDRGRTHMFEAMAACGEYVLITTAWESMDCKYIDDFVDLMIEARGFLPYYAGRHFIGAVAALDVDESVLRYGQKRGLLVLGLGKCDMELLNDAGFEPHKF